MGAVFSQEDIVRIRGTVSVAAIALWLNERSLTTSVIPPAWRHQGRPCRAALKRPQSMVAWYPGAAE